MKRLVVAMLMAVSTVALSLPASVVAGAGYATCEYNPSNHRVTVAMVGSYQAYLARDTAGHITVDSQWCDGVATVNNTDIIFVTGDHMHQTLTLMLANGGYRPGWTNESGSSDEIEFNIDLGLGTDVLQISGTDAVQKIRLGQAESQFATIRKINLNAGEGTGVDGDIVVPSVDRVEIYAGGGNDIIRGGGKAGTGPEPFGIAMWVYGGNGNDVIRGGKWLDRLSGDAGVDQVSGNGHDDVIGLLDGEGGDTGSGGPGNDTCQADPGDSCTT